MKKFLQITIVCSALLGLYLLAKPKTKLPMPNLIPQTETTSTPVSLSERAKQFPGLTKPNLSDAELKSECRQAIESIETLPLKTLVYDLGNGHLKLNADCLTHLKTNDNFLKGFPQVCEKLENGTPTSECVQKLFFYKALRINEATKNQALDSLATEIIINKLIALLADNAFATPEGLKTIREVGAKLYERLPNSESAAKAAIIGYLGEDGLAEQDKLNYDQISDEARAKFPNNWDIYEMDLIRKKSKNEESFKSEVLKHYANQPESSIAIYYMGCINWSDNKAVLARTFFKSAAERSPADKRFADTLQKSLSMNPPEKICAVQIGFNPDQF